MKIIIVSICDYYYNIFAAFWSVLLVLSPIIKWPFVSKSTV